MPPALTDAQRTTYTALFQHYDHDGDGRLTTDELRQVLHDRGQDVDDATLDDIVRALDDDASGTIELDEFLRGMAIFANGADGA